MLTRGRVRGIQLTLVAWAILCSRAVADFSIGEIADLQWWASAKDSALFQDSAGTLAAAPGGQVGFISDLSGNGHHAVMGSEIFAGGDARRPLLKPDVIHGAPGVLYDGVDDFSSLEAPILDDTDEFTLALVVQAADVSLATKRLWGASNGVEVGQVRINGLGRPTVDFRTHTGGSVSASDNSGFTYGGTSQGYTAVLIARFRAGQTGELWHNGILRASDFWPGGSSDTLRSVQKTFLGNSNAAGNSSGYSPIAGDYAKFYFLEGLATKSYISDTQLGGLYEHLSEKWPGVQNLKGSRNLYWNSTVNPDRSAPAVNAGHLQGVAAKAGERIIFHTGMIEKYDAGWNLQTNNQNVFANIPTDHGPVTHLGDGDYYAGKVFAPAETDLGGGGQFIAVYDANAPGMPLVAARDITAQHHEFSSLVVVPQHGGQGVIYGTSFVHSAGGQKLWMYDFAGGDINSAVFGRFLGTLDIPSTVTNIQGVEWSAPYFYFSAAGGSRGNRIERVRLAGGVLDGTSEIVVNGYTTVQGLAFDGDIALQAFQSGSTTEIVDLLRNVNYLPYVLGDMNGDGTRDNFDIAPFEQALTQTEDYLANFSLADYAQRGDLNGDSFFDNFDIGPFEHLLTSGTASAAAAVPEPSGMTLALVSLGCLGLASRARRRT